MSIRRKILAVSILVALFLAGYVVLFWYPNAEQHAIAGIESNTHDKLAITTEVLVPLLIKRQYAAIHENLDAILERNEDWIFLELVDDTGRKLYPLSSGIREGVAEMRVFDRDIIFRDNRLGKLRLSVDLHTELRAFRSELLNLSAVLSIIFVISMIAIIYFVDVFVSSPALKLAELADDLARGDYDRPLPKTGNDELGKLAQAFDGMRRAILEKTGTIQQFGQIMDDSINEIFMFDTDTLKFIQVNRGARENLQYLIDELRAMTPIDIKPQKTEEEFRAQIAPLLAGEVSNISFTTLHRRKDGTDYPAEINLQLSKVTDPPVFVAVVQDISERLEAEQKMRQANENLEAQIYERTHQLRLEIDERKRISDGLVAAREEALAANLTKSEFLAHMSHELRSPLNAIIGFSEAITCEVFGKVQPPQYEEYLHNILGSGQHLLELINDILDLSAVESGKLELRENEVEISDVFESVLTMLRPRAEDKRLRVINNAPEPFPMLRADERRIKQIMINFISNAIKFTETKGKIELNAGLREDGTMFLSVSDTGIGMSEQDIVTALAEFGQVRNTSSQSHEGTGLGLPLSAALARVHDGDLEIESAPGKGTTLTVWFPANRIIPL